MSDYVKADIDLSADYPIEPRDEHTLIPKAPQGVHVSFVKDEEGVKPGDENLYDGMDVTSIPASSREVVEWMGAHRQYLAEVKAAHDALHDAEMIWRGAMQAWERSLSAAAAKYAPVQEEIENRKALVEAEDDLLMEREREAKEAARKAAEDAEDAVMGHRNFVLFHRANHLGFRQQGVSTLHLLICPRITKASQNALSLPMRAESAREALTLPKVKACGTCNAEEHLNLAEQARRLRNLKNQP